MGSEWQTCTLKEAGVQLIDCDHKTPKAQESGFPYIGIPQMKEGNIDFDANPRLISQSDLVTWTKKAKPQTNDVILSRRCNSGETVHVASRTEFALGQNLVILRSVGERVFPPYLRWVVRSPQWWAEVSKYLNPGAIFESLKCADIPKFKVPVPPLPEQKAIAHILGTLDDKIELNRRMNATLEGMAQALFKSWFVDFDPVIDNALAAGNPIPDELAARAEVRRQALATNQQGMFDEPTLLDRKSLFPAAFKFTEEMGWIPDGWEVGQMSDHASIEMGQSPKGDTYNTSGEGMPLVNGPVEFGPYFTNRSKWTTSPTKRSAKGDLIVCVRGSTTGRFVKSDGEYCLGRGVCSVRGKRSQCFVDQIFKSSIETMLGLTTGSTFPNWSRQTLSGFETVIPPVSITDQFEELISPKIERIESGVFESETLTKLRDNLLPKLISGELHNSKTK